MTLITKVDAPSILEANGVTVMLFVPASPRPSLTVNDCPSDGEAYTLTVVADPADLLMITMSSVAVVVIDEVAVVKIRIARLVLPDIVNDEKLAAAAVEPPITVLSIVPPVIATLVELYEPLVATAFCT